MFNKKFKTKRPWLMYTLQCENDVLYIGLTTCIPLRLWQHCTRSRKCSHAVLNNPPIDLLEVVELGIMPYWKAEMYEDAKTIACMERYGIDHCFGGRYCLLEHKECYRNLRSGMYPEADKWLKKMHLYAQKLASIPKKRKHSNFTGNEWRVFYDKHPEWMMMKDYACRNTPKQIIKINNK